MLEASPHRSELLRALAQRIQEIEASQRPHGQAAVSLGIPALDSLFEKGLPSGSLVELLSTAIGGGAWTLGLVLSQRASEEGKALVIIDTSKCFYPPAAARLGVDLERTIVVHPRKARDLYAAANLALRCPAVGAVVAGCDHLHAVEFRRLQLSAEAGNSMGILLRDRAALPTPSFATLRLLVTPVPALSRSCRLRLEIVRCRGGQGGQSLLLEIDGETGAVRVPAPVAPATASTRPARASG